MPAAVPILAMTANAFKEDEEAAEEADMQAHIARPIDVNVLRKTRNTILPDAEKETDPWKNRQPMRK